MNKQVWKPGTLLAPVPPIMVSCGTMEKPNIITVAWAGLVNTVPPKTYISVRPSRYSYELIKKSGEFVINLTTQDLVRAADICGVKSGKDVDKFKENKLTAVPSSKLSVPLIDESPVNIECKVTRVLPLGSHDMFIADIVAVNVAEEIIDKNGKLRLDKAGLVAYAHGNYYALGDRIGSFGFSVAKKPHVKHRNRHFKK